MSWQIPWLAAHCICLTVLKSHFLLTTSAADLALTTSLSIVYLGVCLFLSSCFSCFSGVQQRYSRLDSVVRFRANRYECLRGMWKRIAVPSITNVKYECNKVDRG